MFITIYSVTHARNFTKPNQACRLNIYRLSLYGSTTSMVQVIIAWQSFFNRLFFTHSESTLVLALSLPLLFFIAVILYILFIIYLKSKHN